MLLSLREINMNCATRGRASRIISVAVVGHGLSDLLWLVSSEDRRRTAIGIAFGRVHRARRELRDNVREIGVRNLEPQFLEPEMDTAR